MARIQRSRVERSLIVGEWRRSGRSQRAFCVGTDIRPSSLSRWARECDEAEFVEVVLDDETDDFEEVDARPDFVVVLPSQITIGVPLGFDGSELRRLVDVLSC